MKCASACWAALIAGIGCASVAWPCCGAQGPETPEGRGIAFLAREVPRWRAENGCSSCHNNGDGARALIAASKGGRGLPGDPLADTMRWLSEPERWDRNGGDGPFSDKVLARIQFAAALAEAGPVGRDAGVRPALVRAASALVRDQAEDGSWRLDGPDTIGSPAGYGLALATATAAEILRAADPAGTLFRDAVAKAEGWLSRREPSSTLDAASGLLALPPADDPATSARRRRLLGVLRAGRSERGGWGPYPDSPSEPFDTAVVLLALAKGRDDPELASWIRAGRSYLIETQQDDGSWPETTRPPGSESYAQRISTTAWAVRALLATRGKALR